MDVISKFVEMQSPDGAVTTQIHVMDVDGKVAAGWKVVGPMEAHKSNLSGNESMSDMQVHARQIEVDKAAVEVDEIAVEDKKLVLPEPIVAVKAQKAVKKEA